MYGYVYITTNLINNKRYIGQHKSDKFDTKYKGSGTLITQTFKKYGFESHMKYGLKNPRVYLKEMEVSHDGE